MIIEANYYIIIVSNKYNKYISATSNVMIYIF